MIRIDRTRVQPPGWLAERESEGLVALRARYAERVLAGEGRLLRSEDFDRDIYAHEDVKRLLRQMQHMKCCYCERRYGPAYNDVEHFRPKAEVRRDRRSREAELGYWWLAYRFDNLYFACATCNRSKGAYFPLVEGTQPLGPEQDPRLVPEQALLLDPGYDKVEEHLTFVRDPAGNYRITARNGSARGKCTLEGVELDRDELDELRDQYFLFHLKPVVEEFQEAVKTGDAERQERQRRRAQELTRSEAEFSLLAQAAFSDAGLL
jgi:uncharacterized protein (TIGR02646 family)